MRTVLIAAVLALTVPSVSQAQTCTDGNTATFKLLRQIYLDTLGRVPTIEEYEQFRGKSKISKGDVLDILRDPDNQDELGRELRRYHRNLLWTNLEETDIFGYRSEIRDTDFDDVVYVPGRAQYYRGSSENHCVNQEQTEFTAEGRPVPISGSREGWVNVRPYWDPQRTIKICAFDVQPYCEDHENPACGCGADLSYCFLRDLEADYTEALTQEPLRIFQETILSGAPYSDALKTRNTFVNGKLAHYLKYLADYEFSSLPVDPASIPNLAFTDDPERWVSVARRDGHAGVLTTPGFLLRFASNRGRVNRVYSALLCQPFGAADLPDDLSDAHPDLAQRAGCDGCHTVIEPATHWWGRWQTQGDYGYMGPDDISEHSNYCGNCEQGDCNNTCNRYYITRDNTDCGGDPECVYGTPITLAWRKPEDQDRWNVGPKGIAETHRSAIQSCAAENLARHLLQHDAQDPWVVSLARDFAKDEDFIDLMATILSDNRYQTTE